MRSSNRRTQNSGYCETSGEIIMAFVDTLYEPIGGYSSTGSRILHEPYIADRQLGLKSS